MNPTLLFAQEQDFRAFNLDGMAFAGNQITADMNTTNAPRQILGGLSWGPYTYNSTNAVWESADLIEYVNSLESRLQALTYFQPATTALADQYEAMGRVRFVQTYYLTMAKGLNSILEVEGAPMWGQSPLYPEAGYQAQYPTATFTGAVFLAYYTFEGVAAAFQSTINGTRFVKAFLQEMGRAYGSMSSGQVGIVNKWVNLTRVQKVFVNISNVAMGVTALASIAGIAILAVAWATGNTQLRTVAVLLLNTATALVSTSVIISNVIFLVSARKLASSGNVTKLIQLAHKGPVKAITGIGVLLEFAIIWGAFGWAVRNVSPGTIQYDLHLASAIAQTIVSILILVIAALVYAAFIFLALAAPGVGSIVVMAIYLLDALIFLITYFLSEVFGVGKPISVIQELTKAIADALYDVDIILSDLNPSSRLDFYPNIALLDERLGFTVGNGITVTMDVTNTAAYDSNYSFEIANNAAFRYALERNDAPVPATHAGLAAESMDAQWQNLGNSQMRYTTTTTITVPFSDLGYGRDRTLDNQLYLIEGMAVQYSGCWNVGAAEYCKLETINESVPLNVGASQIFDILPDTISHFRAMDWLGYGNTVGQASLAATVPPTDFDNDRVHVSIDPDDTKWDSDGDGLGDYFERTKGTNPNSIDTDGDGLLDGEEFREGTDPNKADTDNDGLNDYIETQEGWLIAYEGGTTRIWSNPIVADYDNDKLSDLEEYMFGFNPYIHTDPSLIDNLIQFDSFDVIESNAPALYLPFDETTTTGAFADLSGNSQQATCDQAAAACPVAGVDGRFGRAMQLDGTNDVVPVAHDEAFNFDTNDDFTIALWVKANPTQTSNDTSILEKWGDSLGFNQPYPFVMRYVPSSGQVVAGRYDSTTGAAVAATTSINDGAFHHVAFTRLDGTLSLYIDGQLEGSTADTTTGTTQNNYPIYIGNRESVHYFAGDIDDLVIFPHGMTAAQVQQVEAGSYNLNDLVFSPGDPFTYQTTVTNTNNARDAEGVLIANSTYVTPTLPNPIHLMQFEIDPARTVWDRPNAETEGGKLTCAVATCPTIDLGVASFDGVDDVLAFPATQVSAWGRQGIQFDAYLDRPLVSGEKMYVIDSILSTDPLSNDQYIDIYFEYESATTARLVIEAQYHTAATPVIAASYSGIPAGSWYRVDYFHNGSGPPYDLKFGPGTVGNTLTGADSLSGKLDNFLVYTQYYNGVGLTGFYDHNQIVAEFNYYEELLFSTPSASALGQSLMDCSGGICPTFDHTGGRYGGGAKFTSTVTEVVRLSNVDLSGDFTIAGWANPQLGGSLLANSYASEADYLAGGQGFNIVAGVASISVNGTGSSGSYTLSGTPVAGWNHFTFVRTSTGLALYLNGVLAQSTALTTVNLTDGKTIRLGNLTAAAGFIGSVDEFAVFDYALDSTQAALLASGKYPAVEIDSTYADFAVPAGTTVTPFGTGRIDADAPASTHRFDQIADVAFDTTLLPYSLGDYVVPHISALPFDELPGHVGAFEYVPTLGNSAPSSITCSSAATCPTAGVQGVDRRGIYFDGTDDELSGLGGGVEGVAMWVKAERGTLLSGHILGDAFSRETLFLLDMDGFTTKTNNGCVFHLPYSLPLNEWVHIAVGRVDKTANYYVNGQLVASQTVVSSINCSNSSGVQAIGVGSNSNDHFKGYIDDLRFYTDGSINGSNVQALYEKTAPLLRFGFDEESFDTVFSDSSGRGHTGTPSSLTQVVSGTSVTVPNPPLGTDGKIGNIAAFNGQGVITVDDPNSTIANLTNDLSMMAWIKPTNMAGETSWRAIASSRVDNSTNGFFFGTLGTKLGLVAYGVQYVISTADITPDLWQHVAVTIDSSRNVTFYINGAVAGTATLSGDFLVNSDDLLNIGGRVDGSTVAVPFQGGIDEFVIYKRTLNSSEVSRDFLTGLRWYRDRGSQTLTIDQDNPTVNLITSQSYFTNSYTMLAVETADPTSQVTLLDFGLKGPSDSAFNWQGASPCTDGAIGRMWCPAFNPATMGGEGRYEVQFRAVDAVGNATTSPVSAIYVDTTAPTATSNHSGEWGTLTEINGRTNSWTVPLAGTVSDGTITGGFAGSGVVTNTVMIALTGSDGHLLSNNRQRATVSGNNWSLNFNILSELPSGTYTVSLQVQDAVGNQADFTNLGTIKLDGVAPVAAVDSNASPQVVSSTIVTPVQGTVSDASGRGVQSVEVILNQPTNTESRALSSLGTWQAAVVSGTDWSYAAPAGVNGFFELDLRATDLEGNRAEKGTQWRGLIDNVAPTVWASAYHVGGSAAKTVYEVLYQDFYIDESSAAHPCGTNDVFTRSTYSTPNLPQDGLTYSVIYTCEVAGHVTAPQDFTICDGAGNCTTSTVTSYGQAHTLNLSVDGGQNGTLGWTQPTSCFYTLYSSPTPYFVGQTAITTVTNGANNYGIGPVPTAENRYYEMLAYNCSDGSLAKSNEVGVFNFTLTPGQ